MKKSILFALLLTACTNPKEKIVEREKAIKIEMQQAEADNWKFIDSVSKLDLSPEEIGANNRKAAERVIRLQMEYDSLEVELKKY